MLRIKMPDYLIQTHTIEDLHQGDLFLYDNYVYMKIKEIVNKDDNLFNAISMDNPCIAECIYVYEDDPIIPLEGTLEIYQKKG